MIPPRDQKVFVIGQNDKWFTKSGGWTDDIRLAAMWPEKQAKSKVRIDIGMPCELVEVRPKIEQTSARIQVALTQTQSVRVRRKP